MGENGSKISENHIQKIDGHVSFPAVWATGTRQGKALDDGKDPPCIRDTFRDVQRHMGASTWVKDDRKSVKITSRQRWKRGISGRLGNGDSTGQGLGQRKGSPVHTRHDLRRSETHGCKYMGETCSKVSENHIQTKIATCHLRPFGRRGLGRARPWTTERIPRAYETRSETFRDTWVQVHG